MDESLSPSDSDYLNSSIGSRSGSIERPGIWVWLSDHINKRRSNRKEIIDFTSDSKGSSPEIIGRSLFYLSSSWNPIEMEPDLKEGETNERSPVDSITTWPSSIDPKSVLDGQNDKEEKDQVIITVSDFDQVNRSNNNTEIIGHLYNRQETMILSSSDEETLTLNTFTPETITTSPLSTNEQTISLITDSTANIIPNRPTSRPVSIQRHSKRSSNNSNQDSNVAAAVEQERYEMRRDRLLQELLTTEEDYVRHLASVINGYIYLMKKDKPYPVPDDLRGGKARIVFANIETIYEWHRDYMVKEIRKCVHDKGPLGPVFKRWLKKLNIYVVYCQNKNKSEFIVQQYLNNYFEDLRLHLGHQLRLADLLIKPIQRIMKYQLILSNLLKYTSQAGLVDELNDLRSALKYMQAVPKTTNDMMALTRLAGYEGSVMTQGNLIMAGILFVGQSSLSPASLSTLSTTLSSSYSSFYESDSFNSNLSLSNSSSNSYSNLGSKLLRSRSTIHYNLKKRYIFLFEKIMLICKVPSRHHAFSEYIYKFHLPMNKISNLENLSDQSNGSKFMLTTENYHLEGSDGPCSFIFKATDAKEKEAWTLAIKKILDLQSDFIQALISPIVHQQSIETSLKSNVITVNDQRSING